VSGSNVQAAKLVGLPVGVPATVKDGPLVTGSCTTTRMSTNALFGEWTEVTVGTG
jgi:hypothetical protein